MKNNRGVEPPEELIRRVADAIACALPARMTRELPCRELALAALGAIGFELPVSQMLERIQSERQRLRQKKETA
jgi:hypothetical protein